MSANPVAVKSGTLHDSGVAWKPEVLETFERTKNWLDETVSWIMPLKNGMIHYKVVDSWESIVWPMNQHRTFRVVVTGMEVAAAYEELVMRATDRDTADKLYGPQGGDIISSCKFILTTEEDNIIPPNAVEDLFYSLYTCPDCAEEIRADTWTCPNGHRGYDAVSGLYFTKTTPPRPMAYGNTANGPNDFRPQSVARAIEGAETIEVNGIAMGCALWRKELFAKVSQPWFQTIREGRKAETQDLYLCRKAKAEAGARFGVNCGVRVGHIDYATLRVY